LRLQWDRTSAIANSVDLARRRGVFADVAVYCRGGHVVHAHQAVLARLSSMLRIYFDQHAFCVFAPLAIVLPDVDVEDVTRLLSLLYTGCASFASRKERDGFLALTRALQLDLPDSIVASAKEAFSDVNGAEQEQGGFKCFRCGASYASKRRFAPFPLAR